MLWRPDTCPYPPCEIEYNGGSADANHVRNLRVCSVHASLVGVAVSTTALDENRRKNDVFNEIKVIRSEFSEDDYPWAYDALRVLVLTLGARLTTIQKTALQTRCNTRFGLGKVLVI